MKKDNLKQWRYWVFAACFTSLSIILTRFFGISIGNTIRFSFGRIPIMLAGCMLGPIFGAIVGGASDILGALLSTGLNPLLTIPEILCGFLIYFLLIAVGLKDIPTEKNKRFLTIFRIFIAVAFDKIITQGILKTIILAFLYSMWGDGFFAFFIIRAGITILEAVVEALVIYFISTNRQINKLLGAGK